MRLAYFDICLPSNRLMLLERLSSKINVEAVCVLWLCSFTRRDQCCMAGVDQRNHLPPWHPPASHTAYADTSTLNSAAQHAPQYKQQALTPDAALALAFGNRLHLSDSGKSCCYFCLSSLPLCELCCAYCMTCCADTKMRPYQHRLSSGDLSSVGQASVDGGDHHMSAATPQRPVGTMTAR